LKINFHPTIFKNQLAPSDLRKAIETMYIHCTYLLQDESTVTREFAALEAIADNYPKLLVSMNDDLLPSRAGIHDVQAWNFEEYLNRSSSFK
jgi:predicted AAA+ superfamily ATPase